MIYIQFSYNYPCVEVLNYNILQKAIDNVAPEDPGNIYMKSDVTTANTAVVQDDVSTCSLSTSDPDLLSKYDHDRGWLKHTVFSYTNGYLSF